MINDASRVSTGIIGRLKNRKLSLMGKGPFKNYVIPLLKVVFCVSKKAHFAAMMMQATQVGVKLTVRIHSAIAALSLPH